jgi:hypothetical protein
MKKRIEMDRHAVVFEFDGLDPIRVAMTDFPQAVLDRAMLHGFAQKIGDAAAIPMRHPDGTVVRVTERMRRDAVSAMVDQLLGGEWNVAGGGEGSGGLLFRAFAEAFPGRFGTATALRAWIDGQAARAGVKPSAFEKSLRASGRLKPILERLEREALAIDPDDALAGL